MSWKFIQDQILGMKWLNELLGSFLEKIGLDISGKIGGSILFFIYDVIKITILLCTLIFIISYIQSYFPPERSKKILGRFKGIGANCIAALLGTVTPFCSCSSIPLFIGYTDIRDLIYSIALIEYGEDNNKYRGYKFEKLEKLDTDKMYFIARIRLFRGFGSKSRSSDFLRFGRCKKEVFNS